MTYAIGDIHGCRVALETLIDRLAISADDKLIFLGDYIDRGSDTKGVVNYLLNLQEGFDMVHLMGNHEVHLRGAYDSTKIFQFFISDLVGGMATLESYGGDLESIPESHRKFLIDDAQLYYETESHIFVHGGVEANVALNRQQESVLTSKRFQDPIPHKTGKVMICGHTIQKEVPMNYQGHSICIDTGCYRKGWLTALQVETGRYFQTNQKGKYREGRLIT